MFNPNFAEILAPPGDGNANSLVFLKKTVKTASKSTHKLWHSTCSNYVPIERTACWPRSM